MSPVSSLLFFVVILGIIIGLHFLTVRNNRKLLQSVTDLQRGTWGERRLVLQLLKHGVSAQTIFHDLYVKKTTGGTSQIDVVVPTKVGIIVFEVKEYSGWIFGRGHQEHWTQVLAYGREKHRLYNPVKQNESHIKVLKQRLAHCADVPYFSVIVFGGNCVLRNVGYIPEDTYIVYMNEACKMFDMIVKHNIPANYGNKYEVLRILEEAVHYGGNSEVQMQHIRNIERMLEENVR